MTVAWPPSVGRAFAEIVQHDADRAGRHVPVVGLVQVVVEARRAPACCEFDSVALDHLPGARDPLAAVRLDEQPRSSPCDRSARRSYTPATCVGLSDLGHRSAPPVTRRRSGSGRRPSAATPGACASIATRRHREPIRLSSRRGMSMTSSSLHHHRVLDLGVDDLAVGADGRERTDERVDDPGAAPIATGPRIVELTISAPASTTTRPSMNESSSTVPSMRVSIVSRISRFASSSGVSLPVSIHQPVRISVRTRQAVVDQPLDRVGDLEFAARATVRSLRPRRGSPGRTGTRRPARGSTVGPRASRRACTTWPSASSDGDTEPMRIRHLLQQDLGGRRHSPAGARRRERVDERRRGPARACCRRGTSRSRRRRGSRGRSDTQCARPSGASCSMYVTVDAAELRAVADRRPASRRGCRRRRRRCR